MRWIHAGRSGLAAHGLRFVLFSLVGASGVVVNFLILTFLVEVEGWNPLLAGTLATEGAILSNFSLNDRWTFRDAQRRLSWPRRLARYHTVSFGGLIISISMLAMLINLAGLHYLIANACAIAGATAWNYGGSFRFTWSMGASDSKVMVRSALRSQRWWRRMADSAVTQISKVFS